MCEALTRRRVSGSFLEVLHLLAFMSRAGLEVNELVAAEVLDWPMPMWISATTTKAFASISRYYD